MSSTKNIIKYKNIKHKLSREPKVSVIILTKNNVDVLTSCITSIVDKTKYNNYKIYIADTGSTNKEITLTKVLLNNRNILPKIAGLVQFDWYKFGTLNNLMVNNYIDPDTELILFCNNDIKFINDVITNAVDIYLNDVDNCGTIGCRLHYGDGKIQHAGVEAVLIPEGRLEFTHKGLNSVDNYPDDVISNVLGNTGACLFIPYKTFNEAGQFNEHYKECFEDVELNLSLVLKGKCNYFSGNSVAFHYESKSRNKYGEVEKVRKTMRDYNGVLRPFCASHFKKIIDTEKIVKVKMGDNLYII